jgi:uncharacterized protein
MTPLAPSDRLLYLDVLRGIALFGVLMVNLLTDFRVSLFEHLLTFHTHPGWADHCVDILVAGLLESKAITLFSFLFGVGVCIQADRAAARGVNVALFLLRRFLSLLLLGLPHMLLIWNGDILCLYALCGLLLIPLAKAPVGVLVSLGIAAIALTFAPIYDGLFPTEPAMRTHAVLATDVYGQGTIAEIMKFRWDETCRFILPLLVTCLPRTFGLMLLGIAAWRAGIVQQPDRHQKVLKGVAIGGGVVGGATTTLLIYSASSGAPAVIPHALLEPFSFVPLALFYAAALLLWQNVIGASKWTAWLAAGGQMALTNYLAQSIIGSVLFYSYGLGFFGQFGPAWTALIGVAIYLAQLLISKTWLQHFRFGPLEWFWRSMTYRRAQPMWLRQPASSV